MSGERAKELWNSGVVDREVLYRTLLQEGFSKTESFQALRDLNAQINSRAQLSECDSNQASVDSRDVAQAIECDSHGKIKGLSPLVYACSSYDQPLALQVLEKPESIKGFDSSRLNVNERHDYGYTPLHYASEAGLSSLSSALLSAGADHSLTTSELHLQRSSVQAGGMTPLHLASMRNHTSVVQQLLSAGADSSATDVDGNTPLVLACMKQAQDCARVLQKVTSQSIPNEDWLRRKQALDTQAARERVHGIWSVPSEYREIRRLSRLFDDAECQRLIDASCRAAEARGGWHGDRHRGYATTDLRVANVPEIKEYIHQQIAERLFPIIESIYSVEASSFRFRDFFFVKYEATEGEQTSVGLHRDGSTLTFNILLNEPSEFEGGGTYIEAEDRVYHIGQGEVLLHSGKLRHAGEEITRGRRFLLIGFLDIGDDEAIELHFQDHSG